VVECSSFAPCDCFMAGVLYAAAHEVQEWLLTKARLLRLLPSWLVPLCAVHAAVKIR
jgi:hypothetical protein